MTDSAEFRDWQQKLALLVEQTTDFDPGKREQARLHLLGVAELLGTIADPATQDTETEDNDEGRESLYSDEALGVLGRFAFSRKSSPFTVDEMRDGLTSGGIDVAGVTDTELEEHLHDSSAEIVAYLQQTHGQSVVFLEYDDEFVFAQVVSPSSLPAKPKTAEPTVNTRTQSEEGVLLNSSEASRPNDVLAVVLREAIEYIETSDGISVPRGELMQYLSRKNILNKYDEISLKRTLTALITAGELYGYRDGGKSWVTTNKELAQSKRLEHRRRVRGIKPEHNDSPNPDMSMCVGVVSVFLRPNSHVSRLLSAREVWSIMNGRAVNTVGLDGETKAQINASVRLMEKIGVMVTKQRTSKRGAMSQSASSRVMKMGLASQEIKELLSSLQDNNGLEGLVQYLTEAVEKLKTR